MAGPSCRIAVGPLLWYKSGQGLNKEVGAQCVGDRAGPSVRGTKG